MPSPLLPDPVLDPVLDDEAADVPALLAEVRRIAVQSRHLVTDVLAGGYASAFRGTGIVLDHVREWTDGDDARSIDPSVSARMGRPFVRSYVDERELTVYFLLDLSASTTGGFGVRSTRATAARFVATLALSATRNDDRVGLVAFGSRVVRHVPPKKGLPHVMRIVRDALALPTSRGGTDLAAPLELLSKTVRRKAVVFLCSDFLAALPERVLALAARRHDLVAVRLRLPELDLPRVGLARLRDPESGVETVLDTNHAGTRAAWARRVAAWRDRADAALGAAGVDVMDVAVPTKDGTDTLARPILDFFRRRERRGSRR